MLVILIITDNDARQFLLPFAIIIMIKVNIPVLEHLFEKVNQRRGLIFSSFT
jgi:hypothetical protein